MCNFFLMLLRLGHLIRLLCQKSGQKVDFFCFASDRTSTVMVRSQSYLMLMLSHLVWLRGQDLSIRFWAKKMDKKRFSLCLGPEPHIYSAWGVPKASDAYILSHCLIGRSGDLLFALPKKSDKKSIFSVFGPQSSPYTVLESPQSIDAVCCSLCSLEV